MGKTGQFLQIRNWLGILSLWKEDVGWSGVGQQKVVCSPKGSGHDMFVIYSIAVWGGSGWRASLSFCTMWIIKEPELWGSFSSFSLWASYKSSWIYLSLKLLGRTSSSVSCWEEKEQGWS